MASFDKCFFFDRFPCFFKGTNFSTMQSISLFKIFQHSLEMLSQLAESSNTLFVNSLTHSLSHSLTHSLTHSRTHSRTHSLSHSFTNSHSIFPIQEPFSRAVLGQATRHQPWPLVAKCEPESYWEHQRRLAGRLQQFDNTAHIEKQHHKDVF